jgi:hypothetical protein
MNQRYASSPGRRALFQRRGIGKEVMRRKQRAGKSATFFLFAAPRAVSYYEHLGPEPGSEWTMSPFKRLR